MPTSSHISAPVPFDDPIVHGLAALHGSSRRVIESTMALWPSERLAALHSAGLITERRGAAACDPCAFRLTREGEAAIDRCGRWV
jgi:hypothetical protein